MPCLGVLDGSHFSSFRDSRWMTQSFQGGSPVGTVRPHLSAPQILSSLIYPVPLLYPQFNPERVFVDKGGLTTYWLLVIQFIIAPTPNKVIQRKLVTKKSLTVNFCIE